FAARASGRDRAGGRLTSPAASSPTSGPPAGGQAVSPTPAGPAHRATRERVPRRQPRTPAAPVATSMTAAIPASANADGSGTGVNVNVPPLDRFAGPLSMPVGKTSDGPPENRPVPTNELDPPPVSVVAVAFAAPNVLKSGSAASQWDATIEPWKPARRAS